MTLLADKLKAAGADTFEARFVVFTVEALRLHPDSVSKAWMHIGAVFGHEYLRLILSDMKAGDLPKRKAAEPILIQRTPPAKLSPEKKAKIDKAVQKAVEILTFGYKVADGRDWADVGAHELDSLDRDGSMAREIKRELPVLTGNMRFANLREVLTVDQFKAAKERAIK